MSKYPVPYYIELRQSIIPEAGLGVFAKKDIKKGKRLDDYKGVRLSPKQFERKRSHKRHVWAISKPNGNIKEYIDGGNKAKSNWLRYINCPRTKKEENVYAVQENNDIVYYAMRKIKKGEELMVWYGDEYGEVLGIKKLL